MGEIEAVSDSLATEYLRIIEEGFRPDLDEFVSRVPEEQREQCRARIIEVASLNGVDVPGVEPEATPAEALAEEIRLPELEVPDEEEAEDPVEDAISAALEPELEPELSDAEEALEQLAAQMREADNAVSGFDEVQAGIEALVAEPEHEVEAPIRDERPLAQALYEDEQANAMPAEAEEPVVEELYEDAEEHAVHEDSFVEEAYETEPAEPVGEKSLVEEESFPDEVYEETDEPFVDDAYTGDRGAPPPLPMIADGDAIEAPGGRDQELRAHVREIGKWTREGVIAEEDGDRLLGIYRRVLHRERSTGIEEVTRSALHILLCAVALSAAAGSMLLVSSSHTGSIIEWLLPVAVWVGLLGASVWTRSRDRFCATVLFAAATFATLPATLALTTMLGVTGASPSAQLFEHGPTNGQLLFACAGALAVSLSSFFLIRRVVFAWTTAVLAVATHVAALLVFNLLEFSIADAALAVLPLTLLAGPALALESRGRVRWALPFNMVAMTALVGGLDTMAFHGGLAQLLHLEALAATARLPYLSFAAAGVIMLALSLALERAQSLSLRNGAHILRAGAAIHLVGALYANAAANGTWRDFLLFGGVVATLLVLGRWRHRQAFVVTGLGGVALGSFLAVQLGLVNPVAFTVLLAVGGLLAAFGISYVVSSKGQKSVITPGRTRT